MDLNHMQSYTKRPPRHVSSMCDTIHDTSLNQTHKIHTSTHEEDLVDTISYQQTNPVHVILKKQEMVSSSRDFHIYVTCPH
jgi:hypothetical protein